MSTWELRNACRKNVIGTLEWENTKKYNDLLVLLKQSGHIPDIDSHYVIVESFGLAFSVCEKKLNSEVVYLKLYVQE